MLKRILTFFAFLFALLIFMWTAGFIAYFASVEYGRNVYTTQKTDAIVVLTGGNHRIDEGLDLWSRLFAPELFISGVNESTTRKDILQEWSGERRLPLCCLTLGFEAKTTRQNAAEVKDWAEQNYVRSIRLVTSNYHMPRAMLEFKAAMPNVRIIPHIVTQRDYPMKHKYYWWILNKEYNKSLVRRLEIMTGRQWIKRKPK